MRQIKNKTPIKVGEAYAYRSDNEDYCYSFTIISINDNKVSVVIDDEPFIFSVDQDEIKNNINNKKLRLIERKVWNERHKII